MKRKQLLTLSERVAELVAEHGGYMKGQEATGMNLHRLAHATAIPREETLRSLGLKLPKVFFERA